MTKDSAPFTGDRLILEAQLTGRLPRCLTSRHALDHYREIRTEMLSWPVEQRMEVMGMRQIAAGEVGNITLVWVENPDLSTPLP